MLYFGVLQRNKMSIFSENNLTLYDNSLRDVLKFSERSFHHHPLMRLRLSKTKHLIIV